MSHRVRRGAPAPVRAARVCPVLGAPARPFPRGDGLVADGRNSHDSGLFDTLPVGTFSDGASPSGILDAAGRVLEWTASGAGAGRAIVEGGSRDDSGCGVCRPSARHGRPVSLGHILIGFRRVRE